MLGIVKGYILHFSLMFLLLLKKKKKACCSERTFCLAKTVPCLYKPLTGVTDWVLYSEILGPKCRPGESTWRKASSLLKSTIGLTVNLWRTPPLKFRGHRGRESNSTRKKEPEAQEVCCWKCVLVTSEATPTKSHQSDWPRPELDKDDNRQARVEGESQARQHCVKSEGD